jgi:hypothetical protein
MTPGQTSVLGSAVAAALAIAAALFAQQNFDTVQVRTERVADGLYLLQARGGNIGLSVGADGAFLVDDQYAPLTPKILAAIRAIRGRATRGHLQRLGDVPPQRRRDPGPPRTIAAVVSVLARIDDHTRGARPAQRSGRAPALPRDAGDGAGSHRGPETSGGFTR